MDNYRIINEFRRPQRRQSFTFHSVTDPATAILMYVGKPRADWLMAGRVVSLRLVSASSKHRAINKQKLAINPRDTPVPRLPSQRASYSAIFGV